MTRTINLINSITETLNKEKCKKAQVMFTTIQDDFCIKLINLDTQNFKDKVANIIETRYCESARKMKEGKTYIVYAVANRKQMAAEFENDKELMTLRKKIDKYVEENYIGAEV